MVLEGAIGDAYGAGFEFVDREIINEENHLSHYRTHPLFKTIYRKYTDDTQMCIAIIELMLSEKKWTPINISNSFVEVFKRDPREGYGRRFYEFLMQIESGKELIDLWVNKSDRNGAAMRAYPIGLYRDINEVKQKASIQAEITHFSEMAIESAKAIALISHYFIYNLGKKNNLLEFLNDNSKCIWKGTWNSVVEIEPKQTVEAVLQVLLNESSLSKILMTSVNFGGDVDTVASISAAIASTSSYFVKDIPKVLLNDLENDAYGKHFLISLDNKLKNFKFE